MADTNGKKPLLRQYRSELVESLYPGNYLNAMFSSGVITQCVYDEINSKKTRHQQVECFLDNLALRPSGDIDKFVQRLWSDNTQLAQMLDPDKTLRPKSTAESVKSTSAAGIKSVGFPPAKKPLLQDTTLRESVSKQLHDKIHENYPDIVQEVDPKGGVIDFLYGKKIISNERRQKLEKIKLKQDRCRKMLEPILISTDPEYCIALAQSLNVNYASLVRRIGLDIILQELEKDAAPLTLAVPCSDNVDGMMTPTIENNLSTENPQGDQALVTGSWTKGVQIGSGQYGLVFRGYDNVSNRSIAIKQVKLPEDGEDQEHLAAIRRESAALQQLQHDRIVRFYGLDESGGELSILMELMQGGSLRKKIINEKDKCLSETSTKKYTAQLLEGLEYLHSKRYIHRDIKGANVLLDSADNVKLADFGVSRHINGMTRMRTQLTKKIGTMAYMAPEMDDDEDETHYTTKIDIWSLGCTVVEMLVGNPPWQGLLDRHISKRMEKKDPPVYTLRDGTSQLAENFLKLCFTYDPAARPSATNLLRDDFVTV